MQTLRRGGARNMWLVVKVANDSAGLPPMAVGEACGPFSDGSSHTCPCTGGPLYYCNEATRVCGSQLSDGNRSQFDCENIPTSVEEINERLQLHSISGTVERVAGLPPAELAGVLMAAVLVVCGPFAACCFVRWRRRVREAAAKRERFLAFSSMAASGKLGHSWRLKDAGSPRGGAAHPALARVLSAGAGEKERDEEEGEEQEAHDNRADWYGLGGLVSTFAMTLLALCAVPWLVASAKRLGGRFGARPKRRRRLSPLPAEATGLGGRVTVLEDAFVRRPRGDATLAPSATAACPSREADGAAGPDCAVGELEAIVPGLGRARSNGANVVTKGPKSPIRACFIDAEVALSHSLTL